MVGARERDFREVLGQDLNLQLSGTLCTEPKRILQKTDVHESPPPAPMETVDTLLETFENYFFISVPPQVRFTSVYKWTEHTVFIRNLTLHLLFI